MRGMKNLVSSMAIAVGVVSCLWAGSAGAAPFTLTFEGLGNQTAVGEFYNSGGGSDFGVSFSSHALALIAYPAGSGLFGNEPSASTVMYIGQEGTEPILSVVLNVAGGFNTGLSFYYSAVINPGSIQVLDNVNGTGNMLTAQLLPIISSPSCGPDNIFQFCQFNLVNMPFTGTAKSIVFGGAPSQILFDNITLGATSTAGNVPNGGPVPEPSALFLLGAGLTGIVWIARKRARLT